MASPWLLKKNHHIFYFIIKNKIKSKKGYSISYCYPYGNHFKNYFWFFIRFKHVL